MDFYFLYQGQRFVWSMEKAAANIRKHAVNFETASQVFFDRFVRLEDASIPNE